MQSLTLPFSKSGGRGYLAAAPEYITTFQNMPSVSASVRYSFRFPTRSCRTSETQECVYFPSGAIYKGFLWESIRAQPSRVWGGCWAYRPPGGREDTPARAGGSAAPVPPQPGMLPSRPRVPEPRDPSGFGSVPQVSPRDPDPEEKGGEELAAPPSPWGTGPSPRRSKATSPGTRADSRVCAQTHRPT